MATKASCFTFKVLLRPWSGRALVRVRAGLGLFVCCCRALALLGCSGGAGVPLLCCCLVRGVVLGFRERANRRPLVGLRFVTVSKHKRSFSLNRLVTRVPCKNWTYGQSTPPKPPSRQIAWRGSGAPVSAPQRLTEHSTDISTDLQWQWNLCSSKSRR